MIILKSDNYQHEGKFLDLSLDDTTISVSLYQSNVGANLSQDFNQDNYTIASSQTFDMAQMFRAYSRFGIMLDKVGRLITIDLDAVANSRDGLSSLQFLQNATDNFIIIIYFHDTVSKFVLASYMPTRTSAQYTLRAVNERFGDTVIASLPEAQSVFNILKAKIELLLGVDPNMSLAGLEAQVDLLTQLVFQLLANQASTEQQKVAAQLPWLGDFQAAINVNSVTTLKSAENCVSKMSAVKSIIRGLQKTYYAVVAQNRQS